MQLRDAPFTPDSAFDLRPHRVHEVEGLGQIGFALYQATRHEGPLIWVQLERHDRGVMPLALPQGVMERLQLVRCRSEDEVLWATEEALRATPVSLVIACPTKALSLTAGRRQQLAAEAGGTTGLMLIQSGQGSNAAETRWHCAPVPAAERHARAVHKWCCVKNKSANVKNWLVHWDGKSTLDYAPCA